MTVQTSFLFLQPSSQSVSLSLHPTVTSHLQLLYDFFTTSIHKMLNSFKVSQTPRCFMLFYWCLLVIVCVLSSDARGFCWDFTAQHVAQHLQFKWAHMKHLEPSSSARLFGGNHSQHFQVNSSISYFPFIALLEKTCLVSCQSHREATQVAPCCSWLCVCCKLWCSLGVLHNCVRSPWPVIMTMVVCVFMCVCVSCTLLSLVWAQMRSYAVCFVSVGLSWLTTSHIFTSACFCFHEASNNQDVVLNKEGQCLTCSSKTCSYNPLNAASTNLIVLAENQNPNAKIKTQKCSNV